MSQDLQPQEKTEESKKKLNKGFLPPIPKAKADQIFKLKKKGYSYAEIARTLGVSVFTAHGYVTKSAREYVKNTTAAKGRALVIAQSRLDDFLKAIYDQCLAGDLKSIDCALRIIERQTKLAGLDQPQVIQSLSVTRQMGDLEIKDTLRLLAPKLANHVIEVEAEDKDENN